MKAFAKGIINIFVERLGLVRIFQFLNRNSIVILMIHGVIDEKDTNLWQPSYSRLSISDLEKYLKILSRYYNFVSLTDAAEMIARRRPVQPYSMVLTFDDGYRNNLSYALPVLQRYNVPATFFIPTGFMNNPRPFFRDRIDYALQQLNVDSREVKIGTSIIRLDRSSKKAFLESYSNIVNTALEYYQSDIDILKEQEKIASELEHESGHSLMEIQNKDNFSAFMSWDEIIQANGNITIGSHTVDHIRLNNVDKETAYEQLINSKRDIEAKISKPCFCFCYPYGWFNDEIKDMAGKCGYVCAVTTKEGLNRIGDDLMKLRRIELPVDSKGMNFLSHISGLSAAKDKIKRSVFNYIKKYLKV